MFSSNSNFDTAYSVLFFQTVTSIHCIAFVFLKSNFDIMFMARSLKKELRFSVKGPFLQKSKFDIAKKFSYPPGFEPQLPA